MPGAALVDVDLIRIDGAVLIAIDHVARHVRVAAVHVPQHVLVRDELGRVGEDVSAGGVIEVAVAVDNVPHRHREAAAELVLQPCRERRIDGIAEDDAVARHEEDRVPVAVPSPIQITGERNDLASRSSWLRLNDGQRGEQRRDQRREPRVSAIHDSSVQRRVAIIVAPVVGLAGLCRRTPEGRLSFRLVARCDRRRRSARAFYRAGASNRVVPEVR